MIRRKFFLTALALYPMALFSRIKTRIQMASVKGFKVNAGEARYGEHFKMKGVTYNVLDLKISSEDSGGALAVFEQTGHTPNGGPPLHIHPFQDELFYVIAGKYLFQVGDDQHHLKAGDTIFLPREIPHAFVQLTKKAKMIVAYQPAGKMEGFFKQTSLWESPPSPQEIAKVFEAHDMKVVGPPLKVS